MPIALLVINGVKLVGGVEARDLGKVTMWSQRDLAIPRGGRPDTCLPPGKFSQTPEHMSGAVSTFPPCETNLPGPAALGRASEIHPEMPNTSRGGRHTAGALEVFAQLKSSKNPT